MSTTPLPAAASAEVGLSPARLGRIADVFERECDSGLIPGAVALVARRGRVAYFESFGRRAPGSPDPMRTDALFRIYSMTKPIVSVAAMMLAEEGRLLIGDPVAKYLPGFGAKVAVESGGELRFVAAARPATVQDLLRHTSGICYAHTTTGALAKLYREAGAGGRDQTNADLAARLATLPLAFQPGARFNYGHSTDLVGRIVELVTGKRLGEALAQMVLRPLGMTETGFALPPGAAGRLAEPFAKDPETGAAVSLIPVDAPPQLESAGGGLVSSAMDYARFLAMLAQGGTLDGVRLLGPKTVAYMSADHLDGAPGNSPPLGPGYGFGLDFAVRHAAGVAPMLGSAGEYYWGGVAGTAFWIDPREELFAVLMTQAPGQKERTRALFRGLVYAALEN